MSERSGGDEDLRGPASSTPDGVEVATRTAAGSQVASTPVVAARLPTPLQSRDPRRYEMLGEHGRGGLGRVWRARDAELDRVIAVKELISRNEISESRFVREALLTARLEHPGIVPIHEAGRWPDGTPFYAMKLVAGQSLKARIAACTSLEERLALLDHVIAVADAIAYAHGRKIIHRDLKPANVIVGEFGETVVIDWGLAKDLAVSDTGLPGLRIQDSGAIDDLTSTGVVLGTPAYMAPEQARGEATDERADVFAIGAMLWEVCQGSRVPPADIRLRGRLLRQVGIDRDLAAILNKALHPQIDQRYRDAGDLARDLKAFKAGSRIAARHNSLATMLIRWIRRHRGLTTMFVGAVVLAATGGAIYVRNITAERQRADAALVEMRAQRADAVTARDGLTLRNAQLLLNTDPSAARAALGEYRGSDELALSVTRARAKGLGVSIFKARAHSARTLFIHGFDDLSLISVGARTIVRSAMVGTAPTQVLANDVIPQSDAAYSEPQATLAYACLAGPACLLDVKTGRSRGLPAKSVGSYIALSLAFSPSGRYLATMSGSGNILIWELESGRESLVAHGQVEGGISLRFTDGQTLAVITSSDIHFLRADVEHAALVETHSSVASEVTEIDAFDGLVALGHTTGKMQVIDSQTATSVMIPMCKTALSMLQFVGDNRRIAYGCQDGAAGIWDEQEKRQVVATHLEGGVSQIAESADHEFFIVGGAGGMTLVYNERTLMSTVYRGHAAWVTSVFAPTSKFPYIITGDGNGEIRVWPLPPTSARMMLDSTERLAGLAFASDDGPLAVTGATSVFRWISFAGKVQWSSAHDAGLMAAVASPRKDGVALYLNNDKIELWSTWSTSPSRVVKTDHDAIAALRYSTDGRSLITAGQDGRVVAWSLKDQTHHEVTRIPRPISWMSRVATLDRLTIRDVDGGLWLFDHGAVEKLADSSDSIMDQAASTDGQWLVDLSASGLVRLYDLQARQLRAISTLDGAHDLAISPDGRHIVVAADSVVYLSDVSKVTTTSAVPGVPTSLEWEHFEARLEAPAYSPDGAWLSITGVDGSLWLLNMTTGIWSYHKLGPSKLINGYFSSDSKHYAVIDADGRVFLVDIAAISELI